MKSARRFVVLLGFLGAALLPSKAESVVFFIGTYTGGGSKGVYVSELDLNSGAMKPAELAGETTSPSFIAIHPNRKFLYAANEVPSFIGRPMGSVSAFAIDPATRKLRFLNAQGSGSSGPCHLVVDAAGGHVLVANYGGGSVASLPVQPDGQLAAACSHIQHVGASVDPSRQEAPHAHSINLDAANKFAFAADLGLDKILCYRFDPASGALKANAEAPFTVVAPGSGPRHFAFHPSGKFAYVINEMALTVTAFSYDAEKGQLSAIQTLSTLPPDAKGDDFSTAEIVVSPNGKFVYGSNRGHDSIAVFRVDESKGTLTFLEAEPTQGKTPRNFAVDPTGRFLLAENSGGASVVSFRIDPNSGELSPAGHKIEVHSPVCIRFWSAP